MVKMTKKFIAIAALFMLICIEVLPIEIKTTSHPRSIKRLTYSGNNLAQYPCLSDDGRWMLYVLEIKDGDKTIKTVRLMNIEGRKERELFRDGKKSALVPYEGTPLLLGSKPPILSGNGGVAVFSLSLGLPHQIKDHYLAVVKSDCSDFWITAFPFEALKGRDLTSLEFTNGDWERISHYAISHDGQRMAIILKGHLGPRRYGHPSGLIFLNLQSKKQRTILAPDFIEKEWKWSSFPRRPLSGGGWAFAMSGGGEEIVFGAQSSPDVNDYDLYITAWEAKNIKRLTDFADRWFSLADINNQGEKVAFFYNGTKKQGIGSYTIQSDGSRLEYLVSDVAPRIEFFDMSGDGRYLLFKHIYRGMLLDLSTGRETVAFDEETSGYIKDLIPMDFPRFPAFWRPRIMNFSGDRILLMGPPKGKEKPEIYLLIMSAKQEKK
jgi:hypothetical protein